MDFAYKSPGFYERMESLTPRSSRYASSTDLTDTNTSVDQIDFFFLNSPQFPSMDDIPDYADAICGQCRPEFDNFRSQMLKKVSTKILTGYPARAGGSDEQNKMALLGINAFFSVIDILTSQV